MRRALVMAALALAAFGTWHVGHAAWIHGKALVAQALIARAWRTADARGTPPRPWPGADLRPVARLIVPSRHVTLHVLDSASPRALAFGPAMAGGSAAPNSPGNSVIVGHRDTHFAFLKALSPGDALELEGLRGTRERYRVEESRVVHKSDGSVLEPADFRLTLVTCYPFDAIRPGTPWRYVVVARRVA